ncbi:MAG: TIGR03619 family F420-dependent LLM class oxidoreductase [Myxococcota bacterium]
MKFGVAFSNAGPYAAPDLLMALGHAAEGVGIESFWTIEHVVVPVGYNTEYPYSRSGRLPGTEALPIPDPLLPLAFLAATTSKLRLATGVLILPQRHPTYVAKELATLDVLSRGRAILGVGIGWLKEEFEVLGIPFKERAARTEESIRSIRSLWAEKPEPFEGRFYRWGAVESNPKPVQPGGVPIIVGGHADGAARRAARVGDGFFPGRGDEARLRELMGILREECGRVGRDPDEIEVTSILYSYDVGAVRRAEDLGVSRLVIGPPGLVESGSGRRADADAIRAEIERFGDTVLAKL